MSFATSWPAITDDDQAINDSARAMVLQCSENPNMEDVLIRAAEMLIVAYAIESEDPDQTAEALLAEMAKEVRAMTGIALGLMGEATPPPTGTNCPECGDDCDPDWGCDKRAF